MKNVLIFPAGTEVAFEIFSALKYSRIFNVYGASSVSCHAEFVYEHYIEGIPYCDDPDFVKILNKVINEYGIDFVYPADDQTQLVMTEKMAEINAKVVTSDLSTVETCRSKEKTYAELSDTDFIPKTYENAETVESFPVFVKPKVGQGSNGAKMVNSREELQELLSLNDGYIICEYLPGEEFSVDCFTDRHGNLLAAKKRRRERIGKNGIATRSREYKNDPDVIKIAKDINDHFKFNGAWFFQIKKDANDNYKLLEVSPRIPGTMGASRNIGINFPLLTLFSMMGIDVQVIDNDNELLLDRAYIRRFKTDITYNTVYVDFDDTLIIKDRLNILLLAFLYQCVENKKKIVLITKHEGNLYALFDKHKINPSIFNDIVHLDKDEDKAVYVTDKKSILIDDAFSERLNVHNKVGVPVFDDDMVESLIDYRM